MFYFSKKNRALFWLSWTHRGAARGCAAHRSHSATHKRDFVKRTVPSWYMSQMVWERVADCDWFERSERLWELEVLEWLRSLRGDCRTLSCLLRGLCLSPRQSLGKFRRLDSVKVSLGRFMTMDPIQASRMGSCSMVTYAWASMCPNKSKVTVAGLISCGTRSAIAFPKFCNSRQSDSRVSWLAMSRILSWADWNNKPKKHTSTSSKHITALPHLHAFALLCCFINLDNSMLSQRLPSSKRVRFDMQIFSAVQASGAVSPKYAWQSSCISPFI